MKRYDSYKPSGIEWIGEIPSHWEVRRIKHVIQFNKDGIKIGPFGSSLTGNVVLGEKYKVYGQWNIIGKNFDAGNGTISEVTYNILSSYAIKSGDVLVSMMGTVGKCAVIPQNIQEGIMDSHVVKIRLQENLICPRYFEYIYDKDNSKVVYSQVLRMKKGSIMDGLNSSLIKDFQIIVPPIAEQEFIADYLDKKCGEIDRSIAKQQRRIELLEELKQSVITQAVTRGLDPSVPLRDSGIEWIGEIPEHWSKVTLRHMISEYKAGPFGSSLITSQLLEAGEILVYTPEHIAKQEVELQNNLYLPLERIDEMGQFLVTAGDVIIPIVGTLGRAMIINKFMPIGIINQRLAKFKLKRNRIYDNFFIYYFAESQIGQVYNALQSRGSIIVNLTKQIIYDMPFLLPPLSEQQAIADYLDKRCAEIDSMIEREKKKIELMQELKQSIITEVVTGKRKVV